MTGEVKFSEWFTAVAAEWFRKSTQCSVGDKVGMHISWGPDEERCPRAYPLTLQPELPMVSRPKGFLRSQRVAGTGSSSLYKLCPLHVFPASLATPMNALTDTLQDNTEHRRAPPTWAAPLNSPPLACPLCCSDFSSYRQKTENPVPGIPQYWSQDGLFPLPLFCNCDTVFPTHQGKVCFVDSSTSTIARSDNVGSYQPLLIFGSVRCMRHAQEHLLNRGLLWLCNSTIDSPRAHTQKAQPVELTARPT